MQQQEPTRTSSSHPQIQSWDGHFLPLMTTWWAEITGVVIVLFAILTLLALPGWTSSGLLGGITKLLRQLVGWGAYPVMLTLAGAGVMLLVRNVNVQWPLRQAQERSKFITLAAFSFLLALPLSHLFTNTTFEEAYNGSMAGLIGWALSDPLIELFGRFITAFFYLTAILLIISTLRNWTLETIIRQLIKASGRLQYWAEQLRDDPDQDFVRTVTPEQVRSERQVARTLDQQTAILRPKANVAGRDPTVRPCRLPPLDLLVQGSQERVSDEDIAEKSAIIERTLKDFHLAGDVIEVRRGPAITQFGIKPGYLIQRDATGEIVRRQKVRVSQIANLRADLALALAVPRLRIEAPVPGRGIVGIEVPNPQASMVRLRDVIESPAYQQLGKPLSVALGQDVAGSPIAVDLAKMPHLLIAGTTGSGKSVCMKTIITSLIVNNTPESLRLVLVDPKRVEMIRFNGLPHLLGPAEVEGERIIGVLRWVVAEMDRRYAAFAQVNARKLSSYNRKSKQKMPHLVVLIDELADLMVQFSAETERTLCRLAQMARATGIHLVVATQRPSTDVITGLIKANFPARISFAVASSTDSRVILDTIGADQLLGNGDMLFLSPEGSVPQRVQGSFVDDDEVDRLVEFWQEAYPVDDKQKPPWEKLLARMKVIEDTDDELERAIELCQKVDNLSTSLIQRRLRVGYPRAARLMETLYDMGLVEDPKKGGKTRKTYVSPEDEDPLDQFISSNNPAA